MLYTSNAKVNLNKIVPVLLQVLTVVSELLDMKFIKWMFPNAYKKLDTIDTLIEQLIAYLQLINTEQLSSTLTINTPDAKVD